jgi:hypothetical protein
MGRIAMKLNIVKLVQGIFRDWGLLWVGAAALAVGGCSGEVSLLDNPDPQLRKTPAQFAADAATRSPYKADAPRGGTAAGRASVNYDLRDVHLINTSDEDWHDVEVWINQKYVVFLHLVLHSTSARPTFEVLQFPLFFDGNGNHFPTFSNPVTKVEIYLDGKMYDVPLNPVD